jgi:hypothetical protein
MVDGLGASQNTRKSTVKPPIPAFSITSQHKGILEEQGLLPFLKTDYLRAVVSRPLPGRFWVFLNLNQTLRHHSRGGS